MSKEVEVEYYNGHTAVLKGIDRASMLNASQLYGEGEVDSDLYTPDSSGVGGYICVEKEGEQENTWYTLSGLLPIILKGKKFFVRDDCDFIPDWDVETINFNPILRNSQLSAVKAALKDKRGIIKMPTGCHPEGTQIRMFDGSLKSVEDIEVNDELMGPDSKPRRVQSLIKGEGPIYRVKPVSGDEFYVNDDHVLSLENTSTGSVVNITVNEYLTKSNNFKHLHKLYRRGYDLPEVDLPIDPYILGLWLGDGHSHCFAITNSDKEVLGEWCSYCTSKDLRLVRVERRGCTTVFGRKKSSKYNSELDKLKALDLIRNKHIPDIYMRSSREQRLELLAGIIDTDGYNNNGYIDLIQKNPQLSKDIKYLCFSLGLYCNMRTCTKKCQNNFSGTYFRLSICGNIDLIPVRLGRRKHLKSPNKDKRRTGFTISPIISSDYYGFRLDGDQLYLLSDGTVTHNSGKSYVIAEIARIYLESGYNVLISVNTRALLYQMKKDLIEYGIDKDFIGLVGDGNRETSEALVIGINDSLALDKNYGGFNEADTLGDRDIWLADEAHTLANNTSLRISEHLSLTPHRIGLSATPWSTTGMGNLLTGIFGPSIYEYSETEAIDDGVIMEPQVIMYRSPKAWAPPALIKRSYSHYVYNLLYKHLILNNEKRNKLIADVAANYMDKDEAPLAIIVSKVNTKPNHPEKILPYLKDRGYDLPVISGKTGKKVFHKTLNDLREFNIPGAIFGPGVMKEGVNIKGLGCIVLAGAGSSDLALIQRVGRALRVDKGKSRPLVIDLYDQQSFFLGQASKRMATYVEKYGASNVTVEELSD